jgi:tetratricopeptide (TPR) repeat protein
MPAAGLTLESPKIGQTITFVRTARESDPSQDASEFKAVLDAHPELLNDATAEHLEGLMETPEGEPAFAAHAAVLREAREDPDAAWLVFQQRMEEKYALAAELDATADEIEALYAAWRWDEALAKADEALARATEAGLFLIVGRLSYLRGDARLNSDSGDRAENVEAAIEDFTVALSVAPDPEVAAQCLMKAGLAFGVRIRGDAAENVHQGEELLRAALAQLEGSDAPELRALIQTNLASALFRTEGGDRGANLREAVELCEAAFEYRSPDRDGSDWAYTQLNLAAGLENLAALYDEGTEDAEAAYARVIDEEKKLDEPWLVGFAHYALGRLYARKAEWSVEDFVDAEDEEARAEVVANEEFLQVAREHYEAARPFTALAPDPVRHGELLSALAGVLDQLGDGNAAIEPAREALSILRPTVAPKECVAAGGRLGNLLAERGHWDEAANAYRDAVEASELSIHGRLETERREAEMRRAGPLARWASFAVAKAGDPVEAALILESARTRELRRRLDLAGVDEARLRKLPPELRDEYLGAVTELVGSGFGEAPMAARHLQEVLSEIRTLPAFEDFATGAQAEDLVAATEVGWPLVYVNPTPWGTLLLRVHQVGSEPTYEALLLPKPSSLEVFMRLVSGENPESLDDELEELESPASYLFGISGEAEERDIKPDLEAALPWVGEMISKPLEEALREVGAEGVTLGAMWAHRACSRPCGGLGRWHERPVLARRFRRSVRPFRRFNRGRARTC